MKSVLLLKGGGSTEHEIALISSDFIKSQIDETKFKILSVEIDKNFNWLYEGKPCELSFKKELICEELNIREKIDVAIPCFHGSPGETGDIQSLFELIKLPYFGCNSETSILCFNKLLTKLMLELSGIKTTPFMQVNSIDEIEKANSFLSEHKVVYIKATNQGSSVGCYRVDNQADLKKNIQDAFNYSPFVILEKEIKGRELEVSAFEFNGKIHVTKAGEIVCPSDFYTYEEKYSEESDTETHVEAKNITEAQNQEINRQATAAFDILKLRHLSRIDFFLADNGEILINEVNTFPGHTKISMFPMMMENYGVKYSDFINSHLSNLAK